MIVLNGEKDFCSVSNFGEYIISKKKANALLSAACVLGKLAYVDRWIVKSKLVFFQWRQELKIKFLEHQHNFYLLSA